MVQQPPTLAEIKKSRKPIRNVNIEHSENLNMLERFAVWITNSVGSMGFFIILTLWTAAWLVWNIYAPAAYRFDAYPSFLLWLFISNVLQLLLLPLIMVGQNLQSRHSETRAEVDLEVNLKTERETEVILQHLEYQNDLILKILKHTDNS